MSLVIINVRAAVASWERLHIWWETESSGNVIVRTKKDSALINFEWSSLVETKGFNGMANMTV